MSLTCKEWREEFKKMSTIEREELTAALATVRKCKPIDKHFAWTGLFHLSYEIKRAQDELEKEGKIL